MLAKEIVRTTESTGVGVGRLDSYKLVFNKHSYTRKGDAANIVRSVGDSVWGYIYNVTAHAREKLRAREGGYHEIDVNVVLAASDAPESLLSCFTLLADAICSKRCGPPRPYFDLIFAGAQDRSLPPEYLAYLESLAPAT